VRALYGILLTTSNLKNSQKSKDLNENTRLALWSSDKISSKLKVFFFLLYNFKCYLSNIRIKLGRAITNSIQ
jgi:hypothetical protein